MSAESLSPPRPGRSGLGLPEPPPEARALSGRLQARIREAIARAGGWISFREYMELALYSPGLGYYAGGLRKFGADGDFVTAPELSPLFARCLARQCAQVLEALDGGEILELGAGSGAMAVELLAELERLGRLPERYTVLELSGELRERQRRRLVERVPRLAGRVSWLDRLPQRPFRGLIIGNEVLDAMPVQVFALRAEGIKERGVGLGPGGALVWEEREADAALRARIERLLADLPHRPAPDYVSELNPNLPGWMRALAGCLEAGLVLLIDYGYPRHAYYAAERVQGTLICHYRHRSHEDPFFWPGLQDITANVDFTAVAEAAAEAELSVAGFTTQANFLIGCGLEEVYQEALEADPGRLYALSQQVQRLTLPAEMGERFYAIGLSRHLGLTPRGFALRDMSNRL